MTKIQQSHKDKTAPIPIKGQRIAAPHAEPVAHLIIWILVVILALSGLGYAIYKFDQREKARAQEEFNIEARQLRDQAIKKLDKRP